MEESVHEAFVAKRKGAYMKQESLAQKLRLLRAERGLTLVQASELTGVTRGTLSELEGGKREAYMPTLSRIAEGYGVDVRELLLEEALAGSPGKAEPPSSGAARAAEEVARNAAERAQQLTEDAPIRMQEIFERAASGPGEVGQSVPDSPRTDKARVLEILTSALEEGTITEDEIRETLAAAEASKRS